METWGYVSVSSYLFNVILFSIVILIQYYKNKHDKIKYSNFFYKMLEKSMLVTPMNLLSVVIWWLVQTCDCTKEKAF